ncbi:hypothetical protein SAMN06265376_107232 [Dokdonia pacifica]|uniref:Uncharacterized protein n=2 Tax=Dokdonia pacifica TaxID=1627892 RepID=A0A239CDR0_9FLAO|nr:hypothetical protein SAMN06265376_107232 [Dokdonia pacifica]
MIVLVSLMFTMGYGYAQAVDANNNALNALATYGPDGANIGASSIVRNPPRPIEGTVYLFDTWYNNTLIVTTTQEKPIRLNSNINFNAKRNVFESKIDKETIFTFNFTNIEKIVINNRVFKNIYSPVDGSYRVFEVIAETDDFEIYKNYTIDIREGNPNPLLARANDKYIMRDSYYVKKGKSFKRLKLKKSEILKAAGSKSSVVEQYAKDNNLNFKNERDLQKIVSYYRTL